MCACLLSRTLTSKYNQSRMTYEKKTYSEPFWGSKIKIKKIIEMNILIVLLEVRMWVVFNFEQFSGEVSYLQ